MFPLMSAISLLLLRCYRAVPRNETRCYFAASGGRSTVWLITGGGPGASGGRARVKILNR
jgi:hypothetical protein